MFAWKCYDKIRRMEALRYGRLVPRESPPERSLCSNKNVPSPTIMPIPIIGYGTSREYLVVDRETGRVKVEVRENNQN